MRKSTRFTLFAAALGVVLVTAASALAAFAPKIYVTPTSAGTEFRVTVGSTDDPTARFVLYAPTGTTATLTAAPGTSVGKVTSAHAAAADLGGAILPLAGDVLVANPADPTIVAASKACDDVAHATILVLSLQAAGQTLNVPMFVDATTGAEATFAAYKFVVCLPPPDVPPGTPGRATFGAKLLDADFTIGGVAGPTTAGQIRWRSLWTPYIPQQGKVNPAGTVETQSIVFQPTSLTIKTKTTAKITKVRGKKVVKTTVKVSGALTAGGQGAPGQSVVILAGQSPTKLKQVGKATTGADGSFSFTTTIKSATFFQAKATSPDRDLGQSLCTATFQALNIPCIGATVAGGSLTSNTAKAVPRRR